LSIWQNIFKKNENVTKNVSNDSAYTGFNGFSYAQSNYNSLSSVLDMDLVNQCIEKIQNEVSKITPQHTQYKNNSLVSVNSDIQRILNNPNPNMTMFDFLQKTIYILYSRNNCFLYPMYETYYKDGIPLQRLLGIYPLQPTSAEFREKDEELYINLSFNNGTNYTFKYADIIHLRRRFRDNEMFGTYDIEPLLKNAQINNDLISSLNKSIQASLSVQGIINYGTALAKDSITKDIASFEDKLKKSLTGIFGMDNQSTYTPITSSPKIIDAVTLEFMSKLVTNHYGVSKPILDTTTTREQYEMWHTLTIKPLLEQFTQAFTKTLFTQRELALGNKIEFYNLTKLNFLAGGELNVAVITLTNIGGITINEVRVAYGLPPLPEEIGGKTVQSLNYVDAAQANAYQLSLDAKKPTEEVTPNA